MIGIYLIGAFSIALALFLNRNKTIALALLGLFLILQGTLAFHAYFNFHLTIRWLFCF